MKWKATAAMSKTIINGEKKFFSALIKKQRGQYVDNNVILIANNKSEHSRKL